MTPVCLVCGATTRAGDGGVCRACDSEPVPLADVERCSGCGEPARAGTLTCGRPDCAASIARRVGTRP